MLWQHRPIVPSFLFFPTCLPLVEQKLQRKLSMQLGTENDELVFYRALMQMELFFIEWFQVE